MRKKGHDWIHSYNPKAYQATSLPNTLPGPFLTNQQHFGAAVNVQPVNC